MLDALLKGKAEPAEIAEFAQRRAKQKIPQIIAALEGHRMSDHHRIKKAGLEREWQLVQSAPGLKETSAANVLAEIGPDMSQFPSVRHISSWGGVLSGKQSERGKEQEQSYDRRQSVAASGFNRVRLGSLSEEGVLLKGEILAYHN
jgi:transposase